MGVAALLFLYGLIGWAGLRAAKRARSLYSALIAVGVTALIVSQAVLNSFAVLGLAPLSGVPLPFVSYGSTSLVVMLASMGLLLNVASGATGHVRALAPARSRRSQAQRPARARPSTRAQADGAVREKARLARELGGGQDRDSRGRDGGSRRAGARGGRRAAG